MSARTVKRELTSPTNLEPQREEITVSAVCIILVLAALVPTWCFAKQWLEQRSQRVFNQMIWRDPLESW
jgi:hypothetical protein